MADSAVEIYRLSTQEVVSQKAYDLGDGTFALATLDGKRPSVFTTKSNNTILLFWPGTQPTAGTFTLSLVDVQGNAIGTTGSISWNASKSTMAGNIRTAAAAVLTGTECVKLSDSIHAFAITVPSTSSIQLGTVSVGSLTNGSEPRLGVALASVPAHLKNMVVEGGAADGAMFIYDSSLNDLSMVVARQTTITASSAAAAFVEAFCLAGAIIARKGDVNGPNLSGLVEAI